MSKRTVFIAEIDPHELALRIAEGCIGHSRPPGVDPATELAKMSRRDPYEKESVAGFYRAAERATQYLTECIAKGRRSS